jgi:transposase
MAKANIISKENKEEFIKLYNRGLSRKEIGKIYGVSDKSVEYWLKKKNICLRSSEEAVLTRKGPCRKIFQDDDDIELALSLYYSGASYAEVAEFFGCKWTVINNLNKSCMDKQSRKEAFEERRSDIGLKGVAGFKKKLLNDPDFAKRMSERVSGNKNPCKLPGAREKILEEWHINKDARVSACMSKRPMTKFESRVQHLIAVHDLPFVFVGNGAIVIGGKCPDFVATNGKKIVVEVNNFYHKEKAYGSWDKYVHTRTKHFKSYGCDTIFIDEIDMGIGASIILNKLGLGRARIASVNN